MSSQYRLTCEYIHCVGKRVIKMGFADSKEEAKLWQQKQSGKRTKLPEDDPIRTCPVVRCPMKLQHPRYIIQEVD